MVVKFERVAQAVADVHPQLALRSRLQAVDAAQPQQTLAVLALALLDGRLAGEHVRTHVQDLMDEAEDLAAVRIDGQAVVADITAAMAVADLAEFVAQGRVAGEVEFGAVMHEQGDVFARALRVQARFNR